MSEARKRVRVAVMTDVVGVQGGAEKLALESTMALDRDRFEPVFVATRWRETASALADKEKLAGAGIDLLGMNRRSRFDLRPWPRLIRELRARKIDVLHTHKIGANIWGGLIAPRIPECVFVAHEHTWSFEGQPLRKFLDRELIARRADAFVAVSELDRKRMAEIERIPESKLRFIPNGIGDLPDGDGGRELRRELGIPADAPVVGLVATIRPQKSIEVLIRAARRIADRFPKTRILIVGGHSGQELQDRLEAEVEALGVESVVRFLGPRSDIPDLVATFDIGVLCSDFEGSPLSILEYMDAGKPVVATRVGGVPDMVVEGETGLLVDPGDPDALATAIVDLIGDPDRCKRMGEAGRQRRRTTFTIENTASQIGDLYLELLGRKVSPSGRQVSSA